MRSKAFVMAEEFNPSSHNLTDSSPKGPYSHEFLNNFKISSLMKSSLYGIRPIKLKTRIVFDEIDQLLNQRFERELSLAKKSMSRQRKSKKGMEMFSFFVFQNFKERFNNRVLAEKKLLTFLFSIHCLRNEYEYVDLFCELINDHFQAAEVNCLLLLR
jgi:hypothetical protein